ncbi:MAG: glycosyltransferase family 2 protein, partial [Desulfomonile tiedjei]|nr:glycosyltransferase family 2 protein [Desulfomonile tiedjei]
MSHDSENRKLPLISIVVPCYNEEAVFPFLRQELVNLADSLKPRYRSEFVLIDDGSRDSTWDQMLTFASDDHRVAAISLSRNFGHQAALTCGYDLARGDAVVTLDADLQDSPEVVLDMVSEWEKGADVVFAVRTQREGESAFKIWTARVFYRLLQFISQVKAPPDAGDFRLMSSRSVDALRKLRETHRYLRGMAGWLGFRTAIVKYRRKPRSLGTTKWPLLRMVRFAMDAIVSFSMLPLRLAYMMAGIVALLFSGYLLYALIRYIFYSEGFVTGWSSLIAAIIVLGVLNLLCLGIIGEYIGRIYEQSKDRPLYLVRQIWGRPDPSSESGHP